MNGGITDINTVDELERTGRITPSTAMAMRERIRPSLPEPGSAAPVQQQWASPAFPTPASPQQAAGSAWGSTAQAILGEKLRVPEIGADTRPPPQVIPSQQIPQQPTYAASMNTPVSVPSSAGAMAANRRQYQQQSAESMSDIRAATEKQLAGKMEAEQIGARRAQEEIGYAKEFVAQQEQDLAEKQRRQYEFDARMQERQDALNAEIDSVKSTEIDPDTRSLGERIGGALSIALGAFGQAFVGGENVALQLVQKQIDDDIMRQREAIKGRREAIGEERQAIAGEREQFSQAQDRADTVAAKGYELAKSKIDLLLNAKNLPDETRARMMEMRGQFEAAQAEKMNAIMQRNATTTAEMLAQEDAAKSRRFGMQMDIARSMAPAKTKPLQAGVVEKIAEVRASRRELEDIKKNFKEMSGNAAAALIAKRIPGTQARKLDSKLTAAMQKYRKAMTGVAMGVEERKEYEKLFPTSSTLDSEAMNQLDAIIESMETQEKTFLESYEAGGMDVSRLKEGGPMSMVTEEIEK